MSQSDISPPPFGAPSTALLTAYLEAYPFPAFVLIVPIASRNRPRLVSRDTDVTVRSYEDVSPLSIAGPSTSPVPAPASRAHRGPGGSDNLSIAWGNEKWLSLTGGRPLVECLDDVTEDRLSSWVDGASQDPPPGWLGEDSVLALNMLYPGVTLNLVKAFVPLSPPSPSHTFCIITSQRAPVPASSKRGSLATGLTPEYRSPASRGYFDQRRPSASPSASLRGSFSSDIGPSISEAGEQDLEPATPSVSRGSIASVASPSSSLPPQGARSNASAERRGHRPRPLRAWRPINEPEEAQQRIMEQAEECWAFMDTVDWSKTSLGPRETWSEVVDPLLSVVFQSKTQDCLWLGDNLNIIYNMNYAKIIPEPGHPYNFGRPGLEAWAVIKTYIEPFFEACRRGESVFRENDLLLFERLPNGELCERYHTWRYNPIFANTGKVIGVYNQAHEVTETVLAERRMSTVRALSEHLMLVRTSREFFDSVAMVLEANQKDAPFVLAYSVSPSETGVDINLESSVGVPPNHPCAPNTLSITLSTKPRSAFGPNADRLSSPTLSAISALSSGSGRMQHASNVTAWPIAKALQSRQCIIVDDCRQLISDFPIRAWDVLPLSAIVIPVCSEHSMDAPTGVVILGLNIKRPLDDDYESWINVIRGQLASSLAQVRGVEEEAKRKADMERMEKAKTAWFRGAAHDLRSPLTLIAGPLEDVLNSSLNKQQRAALSTAKRNVERLMRLVNALLDFSRLEAGRVEGKFVPLDLGLFVGDLAALFRPAVERMGLEYNVDITPSDRLVYIDPTLYETVVSNLIGNALKYTEKGSIAVKVTYTDFAEVSVTDTGVGIPADEVGSVTDWYHRATSVIHSGTQGTGLGLALVRELLRLHGGELLITSRFGPECGGEHGSVFTARVPLDSKLGPATAGETSKFGAYGQQVANEAMRWVKPNEGDSDELAGSEAGSEAVTNTSSRLSDGLLFEKTDTILLVDDSLDMRNYVRHMLSPYCRVIEASNAEDAFSLAKEQRPNLIISDYMMNRTTGMDLLRNIRETDATGIIPFIMMSAVAGDEAKIEALLLGAEDYIPKPFKPKELLARAHLHLQVGKKRVTLEKLYKNRETEIKLLSDYCPSGIARLENDAHIVYTNAAWRQLAGMSEDDDPDTWPQYIAPLESERLLTAWHEWQAGTEPELKLGWTWSTGRVVSVRFIRLHVVNPELAPGVLACFTDITHEEQRIVEAEKRRLEAEESKHQQELLIDLTSHEIRTPVSAILQCSALVKENLMSLNESLRLAHTADAGFRPTEALLADIVEDIEALDSIYQCGLVQERIASDVLSLARIQLDMLSLYDIEMDLRREARKVLSVFASEAKMKRIELALEFGETLEKARIAGIKTDPVRLGQVVTNLISNAIRFTAGSDVRKITVRYEVSFVPPEDETCALPKDVRMPETVPAPEDTSIWLFVSVRDTGPGMSPKELALLFQRFQQGNKMIHTRYGGSGLGLFICRKITELLGGQIEVESVLGEGSVFRFFIKTRTLAPPTRPPLSIGALAEHDTTSANTPGLTASVGPTPQSSFSSSSSVSSPTTSPALGAAMHILIVEDNIINQTVLKRQIIKAGWTCDVANNGLEALNHIRETERSARRGGPKRKRLYDCVVMDLEMPVMDGLTAVREIRSSQKAGTIGTNMVIALTGNARQGQIDQALAAGMDDVVIKPYVLVDLLARIRTLVNKKVDLEAERQAAL